LCAEDGVKYASGEYRGAKLRRMRRLERAALQVLRSSRVGGRREPRAKFSNLVTGWAVPFPLTLIRRDWTLFFVGFRSWRKRARWAWHKLNAAPSAIRIVVIAATVLAVFSATN